LPHPTAAPNECGDERPVGKKGEWMLAGDAANVLEEHEILAVGAVEGFHDGLEDAAFTARSKAIATEMNAARAK
jgi:hypothetical protein